MKLDYQSYYQDKIGEAKLNTASVIAGKPTALVLEYKVGEVGIVDGGTMKVLFRISSDVSDVQFDDPKKVNYVKIRSNSKNVKLSGYSRNNGARGKIHVRPFTNGFMVFISDGFLIEGDTVFVEFKNFRMQTFTEDSFEFKLVVDPFAQGNYIELLNTCNLKVVPDKPVKLVIVAPTVAEVGVKFKVLIKLEDKWGNPCINSSGVFRVVNFRDFGLERSNIKFSLGKAVVETEIKRAVKVTYLKASYGNYMSQSNPIVMKGRNSKLRLWADLHWQSKETGGSKSLEECLRFARDYAHLDVVSPQGNDFQLDNNSWSETKRLVKKYSQDGRFVVLTGYEWCGGTGRGGDRNVIFLNGDARITRSSHSLLEDFSDIGNDSLTAEELFSKLRLQKAITIAHVGGRYSDLDIHDENVERALEVHSDWGTFEWFLFDALEKGYKLGIVAGSDSHNGRPGASYPGLEEFDCYGGLTCILADKFDKKSVFEAIYNRHCYATTGARIYLEATCVYKYKNKTFKAEIGEEIPNGSKILKILADCQGTSPIEKIEVFNKSQKIKTVYLMPSKYSYFVKIVWSGRLEKGRNRNYPWSGKIDFSSAGIKKIERVNMFHHTKMQATKNSVKFSGFTTGNTQGVIVELADGAGYISGEINGKEIKIKASDLSEVPVSYQIKGVDARVEFSKAVPAHQKFMQASIEYEVKDEDIEDKNALFIKITQRDGHMLWASPFYFSNRLNR